MREVGDGRTEGNVQCKHGNTIRSEFAWKHLIVYPVEVVVMKSISDINFPSLLTYMHSDNGHLASSKMGYRQSSVTEGEKGNLLLRVYNDEL